MAKNVSLEARSTGYTDYRVRGNKIGADDDDNDFWTAVEELQISIIPPSFGEWRSGDSRARPNDARDGPAEPVILLGRLSIEDD